MQINNVEVLFEKTLQQSKLTPKQRAVLSTSLNLFAEQGFDRTSTSAIAKQANVAEGTVFKQFKTKNGILNALMDPLVDQVFPMVAAEFLIEVDTSEIQDFENFLAYVIQDRMTFALDNQKLLKVFAQEAIRRPEIIQKLAIKMNQALNGKVHDYFQIFKQSGQLIDWPVTRIARYIMGTLASIIVPQILLGVDKNFNIQQASRDAAHFLARGLAPQD